MPPLVGILIGILPIDGGHWVGDRYVVSSLPSPVTGPFYLPTCVDLHLYQRTVYLIACLNAVGYKRTLASVNV